MFCSPLTYGVVRAGQVSSITSHRELKLCGMTSSDLLDNKESSRNALKEVNSGKGSKIYKKEKTKYNFSAKNSNLKGLSLGYLCTNRASVWILPILFFTFFKCILKNVSSLKNR